MSNINLYLSNAEKIKELNDKVRIGHSALTVTEVTNGIVLPLRTKKIGKVYDNIFDNKLNYEGGVCTEDFEFVAGFERDRLSKNTNLSCKKSYIPDDNITKIDETVIFGGVLINHFGHQVIEAMSRIWYWLEHRETKLVFLLIGLVDFYQQFLFYNYLDLLGIDRKKIYIAVTPLQFTKVLVPEEAVFAIELYANMLWLKSFDYMREQAKGKSNLKKVYLTRRFLAKDDGVNEEFLEDFYRKKGYAIIAPERLPLASQIEIMAGAEHIAATIGTLSHMILFSENKVNLDVYIRDPNSPVLPQSLINEIKDANCNYIEITKNFFPTFHADGVYFYYPTKYFKAFCQDNAYSTSDLNEKKMIKKYAYQYVVKYIKSYSSRVSLFNITKVTSFDFVYSLNKSIFDKSIDRSTLKFFNYSHAYGNIPQRLRNIWKAVDKNPISDIVLYCYFTPAEGWHEQNEASAVTMHKGALKALKICSRYLLQCRIVTKSGFVDEKLSNSYDYCGSYNEDNIIQSVAFNFIEPQKNLSIGYRVYIKEFGWTDVKYNGEACGIERNVNDISFIEILALQVFIEKYIN